MLLHESMLLKLQSTSPCVDIVLVVQQRVSLELPSELVRAKLMHTVYRCPSCTLAWWGLCSSFCQLREATSMSPIVRIHSPRPPQVPLRKQRASQSTISQAETDEGRNIRKSNSTGAMKPRVDVISSALATGSTYPYALAHVAFFA